ncbi:hypothetical protein Tco_0487153 [Tanacetum coccineum]
MKTKDVQESRPVVKQKSSTPVSNPFSALGEDNGNVMDDLVADTRKKVKLHYFDRDALEFANMDQVVEEAEHENAPNEHG